MDQLQQIINYLDVLKRQVEDHLHVKYKEQKQLMIRIILLHMLNMQE